MAGMILEANILDVSRGSLESKEAVCGDVGQIMRTDMFIYTRSHPVLSSRSIT